MSKDDFMVKFELEFLTKTLPSVEIFKVVMKNMTKRLEENEAYVLQFPVSYWVNHEIEEFIKIRSDSDKMILDEMIKHRFN